MMYSTSATTIVNRSQHVYHVHVFVHVSVCLCVDQGVNVDGKRSELHSSGT